MPTTKLSENQWLNAILTAAIIGLIGWNLKTTHDLSIQVARIEERLDVVHTIFTKDS